MSITYVVGDFTDADRKVEVTYSNASGFVHKRNIHLPRLEDGAVDQEYFDSILEAQLRGVINKDRLGVIIFVDPNAKADDEEI